MPDPQHDPRIDAYIAQSAAFAQPLLMHLRAQLHAACPEAAETIKWGMPSFTLDGRILAGMAAFKAHCTFGLWLSQAAEAGGKSVRPMLAMPDDLRAALAAEPQAGAHFRAFAPGKQRDYIEWITEAKKPETRAKRLRQSLEWLAEGKSRNWKYENC